MGTLRNSVSIPQAYQENPLDTGLDTFPSLVSISEVRECVTKTLQEPPSSGDTLTRVMVIMGKEDKKDICL